MNLLLVDPDEIVADRVVLSDRRATHLRAVLKVAPGDVVRAGVVGGRRGRAIVRRLDDVEVEVELELDEEPSPTPRVWLLLAVPRPKALGRAIEAAATAGVARVDLTRAWRVERGYLAAARLAAPALAARARLGCEQGGSTAVPSIVMHERLMGLLDGPSPWPADALRVVAHPRAVRPLEAAVPPGDRRPVVLAIGPDGGFVDRELATFEARGFAPAGLGEAVLRTEHAVTAALAQLALLARLAGP